MKIISTLTVPRHEGKGVRVLTIAENDRGRITVSWETVETLLGTARVCTRLMLLDNMPADHPYRLAAEKQLQEIDDVQADLDYERSFWWMDVYGDDLPEMIDDWNEAKREDKGK